MDDRSKRRSNWETAPTENAESYRSLSPLAAIALGAGIASPLVFIHVGFSFLPVIALLLGLLATWRIAANPHLLTGRPLAMAAIVLGVVCLTARWVGIWRYRAAIRAEGIAVAKEFIDHLQQDEPQMAHQMQSLPWRRIVQDTPNDIWRSYFQDATRLQELLRFTAEPSIHALLLLGERADVRLYEVQTEWSGNDSDHLQLLFVATYESPSPAETRDNDRPASEDAAPGKRSFFFQVGVERQKNERHQKSGWRISGQSGPELPEGWEAT